MTATSIPSATVNHTSSLDEGAKAGIGVGVALAAVAIVALLAWVILLRKSLRSHGQAQYPAGRRYSSVVSKDLPREELQDSGREHELSGYHRPHELDGR